MGLLIALALGLRQSNNNISPPPPNGEPPPPPNGEPPPDLINAGTENYMELQRLPNNQISVSFYHHEYMSDEFEVWLNENEVLSYLHGVLQSNIINQTQFDNALLQMEIVGI